MSVVALACCVTLPASRVALCCAVENICVLYCISTFTTDTISRIGTVTLNLPLTSSHCLPRVALWRIFDAEDMTFAAFSSRGQDLRAKPETLHSKP